jgi:hypothetical protein
MQTPASETIVPPARQRAAALQQARQDALVVLPDISRKTGYGIADLIRLETGQVEVSPHAYAKITSAIEELVGEREHRYSGAAAR